MTPMSSYTEYQKAAGALTPCRARAAAQKRNPPVIVARLKKTTQPDGKPYLDGRIVCNWPLTIGTRVVLKKEPSGEYVLIELGPRKQGDRRGILSFVDE